MFVNCWTTLLLTSVMPIRCTRSSEDSGYKFLGEMVVQLDNIYPQVASRMVSAFSTWKRYDETRRNLAKALLEMILAANGLSENVFEIASKSLAA
ncbi:puromycin-sensitive aminopeptidase-like [Salvia miltiorrhiza]|uniref:puromycin-sensitive aminopeptidase-like n=1 Tax=Salvia miltiorrhiza TaxID=226208 RepID=UPI0025ACD85E|nr:puromycin-sensitive aminopeptidase-like [Salvia miltiorrhiza]